MEIQKLALGFGTGGSVAGTPPQGQRSGSFSVGVAARSDSSKTLPEATPNSVDTPVSQQDAQKATQKIQKDMSGLHGNIQFSVDAATGKTLIKVVDAKTKDVLMQMPSKTALAIAQMLDEGQHASLINDKA